MTAVLRLAAIVVGIAVLVPGFAAGAQSPRRDVVIGMVGFPENLNKAFSFSAQSDTVARAYMDSEVNMTPDYQVRPVLVTQVPSIANGLWKVSQDGTMELTWKLKPNVRWHDGTPLTADDVVFTYTVAKDERVPIANRELTRLIERVTAPDRHTVVVSYKERYAYADQGIVTMWGLLPKHVLEPHYRSNPQRLPDAPYGTRPEATIGTGPYILKSIVLGNEIVLEANPRYHQGRPAINRVVFRIFQDVNALLANVLSGAVDLTLQAPGGLSFTQVLQLEDLRQQGRARGLRIVYTPTCLTKAIFPDHASAFFTDKRVRQALAYGTNGKAIVDALFKGKQVLASGHVPTSHPGWPQNLSGYPYDVARARALLADAGWTPGADGVLVGPAGRRFSVRFTVKAESGDDQRAQQILQQQWRQLGIETQIRNMPERQIIPTIFQRRDPPPIYFGDVFTSCSQTILQFRYHSGQIASESNGYTGFNIKAFRSAEADRIALLHDAETARPRRLEYLRQFQRVFREELPEISVYHVVAVHVMKEGLANVAPTGELVFPGLVTRNIHEWRWR